MPSDAGTVEPKRLPDFFSGSAAGLIVFRLPNSEPPDACLVTGAPNRLPDSTGFYSTFAGSGSVFPAKVPPPIGLNLGSTFDAGAPNRGFAGAAEPKSPPEDGFLLRSTPPNEPPDATVNFFASYGFSSFGASVFAAAGVKANVGLLAVVLAVELTEVPSLPASLKVAGFVMSSLLTSPVEGLCLLTLTIFLF